MKWICTTSDKYHHILPTFFMLWERVIGKKEIELVGYKRPDNLPDYCTFVSLGIQRGPKFFSDDLRPYFEKQPDWFVWIMEDTFLKSFDIDLFRIAIRWIPYKRSCGKFNLTNEAMRREHKTEPGGLFIVGQNAKYRLSTQPAIWNREYLLQYLNPGLSPWDFETQPQQNDGWVVVGKVSNIIYHNEGVTRHDIHKLNLDGIEI